MFEIPVLTSRMREILFQDHATSDDHAHVVIAEGVLGDVYTLGEIARWLSAYWR
jgi:hypothetical protein